MPHRFFSFTDFNGEQRHVRMSEIIEVQEPSNRVHANGGLRLRDGTWHSFQSQSSAEVLLTALRENPDA